ncbi:hypothetical protein Agau_C101248 [Agrobacterium tumefaciens F2]|nr:hypothetical protein Agau_C101248 [Agrobacterium tumefaciens F2]
MLSIVSAPSSAANGRKPAIPANFLWFLPDGSCMRTAY